MNITRILTLSAMAAAAAYAQTTGTITVTGSVPESISMTNASDTLLNATSNLTPLVVANNSTLARLATPVVVRLRSNKAFKLSATVVFTRTGPGADDGGQAISLSDIGFGITDKDTTLGNVVQGRLADSITGIYDYMGAHPFGTVPPLNGHTPFVVGTHGTLNDLAGTPQVLTGNRISNLGNITSTDNFMKLTFDAAMLPQYFSPLTAFSAAITLTPVLL